MSGFLQMISNIAHNEKTHVIMVDFIFNALASSISELVSHFEQTQYELIVDKPTHIMGGLLHHGYNYKELY